MDLLLPEYIDRMRRPRLAEMLAIARGSAYLLSSEGEEGDEHLTVLIVSAGTWGLITDDPADLEKGESYQLMTLTAEARSSLRARGRIHKGYDPADRRDGLFRVHR